MTTVYVQDAASEESDHPRPARIFVALRIAPRIADRFAQIARALEKLPVRLVAPADIHLTLVPPWNEVSIPDAIEKLRGVADKCAAFTLEFRRIGYGAEPRRPRFLWVECAAGRDIAELRSALLLEFGQTDERSFRPHVTLARLRGNGAAIARKHPIGQDLSLTQQIDCVELMQSPAPGERGYRVLASLRLGGSSEKEPSAEATRD